MAANTPEYTYVVSVLRSLLNSRKDQVGTLSELFRDYKEVEGKALDCRKLGFRNIEDFLRSSDQFLLTNFRGEVQVRVKASEDSQHIARMISAQRKPKRGGGGGFKTAPRRLHTNRSDYNRPPNTVYTRMPSTPMKSMPKYRQQVTKHNVTFNTNNNNYYTSNTKSQIGNGTGNQYKSSYIPEDRSQLPTYRYNGSADLRKPLEQSQPPPAPAALPTPAPAVQPTPAPAVQPTPVVPAEPVERTKPKILYKRSNSNSSTGSNTPQKTSPEINQTQSPPQQQRFTNLKVRLQQPTIVPDQTPAPTVTKPSLNSRLVRHSSTGSPTKAPSPILTVTINNPEPQNHSYQNGNAALPMKKSSVQQRMQIISSPNLSDHSKEIKVSLF
jgi:hypothetical protein